MTEPFIPTPEEFERGELPKVKPVRQGTDAVTDDLADVVHDFELTVAQDDQRQRRRWAP